MNKYTFTVVTQDDTVEHSFEALRTNLNIKDGVIEAAFAPGHIKMIRLPEDWLEVEATEEVDTTEANIQEVPLPEVVPVG